MKCTNFILFILAFSVPSIIIYLMIILYWYLNWSSLLFSLFSSIQFYFHFIWICIQVVFLILHGVQTLCLDLSSVDVRNMEIICMWWSGYNDSIVLSKLSDVYGGTRTINVSLVSTLHSDILVCYFIAYIVFIYFI